MLKVKVFVKQYASSSNKFIICCFNWGHGQQHKVIDSDIIWKGFICTVVLSIYLLLIIQ